MFHLKNEMGKKCHGLKRQILALIPALMSQALWPWASQSTLRTQESSSLTYRNWQGLFLDLWWDLMICSWPVIFSWPPKGFIAAFWNENHSPACQEWLKNWFSKHIHRRGRCECVVAFLAFAVHSQFWMPFKLYFLNKVKWTLSKWASIHLIYLT